MVAKVRLCFLSGELDVSGKLTITCLQVSDADCWNHIPLSACTKLELEIGGINSEGGLRFDASGKPFFLRLLCLLQLRSMCAMR